MLKSILEPFLGPSYQTALDGILTLASTILVACYVQFWDGDAATVVQWELLIPTIFIAKGIFSARDNGVTSESVKAAGELRS